VEPDVAGDGAKVAAVAQSDTKYVVELVGDLGPPTLQHLAAQHTSSSPI
jgi:hypothetical protein